MTTSGVTTGTMTAQEVVQAALEELGVLSAGERAEGTELEVGIRQLNWMLKSFTARGINQWRKATTIITIPANVRTVTLPPVVEEVTYAAIQAQGSYTRPLARYEAGQYPQIASASRGFPVGYYVDRQRDACRFSVWPTPAVDTPLIIDVLRVIEDITDPTETLDVPSKWLETVYIALAARMATVMGVTRTDPATATLLAQRAQSFEQLLLDDDRPPSIFMGDFAAPVGAGGGISAPLPGMPPVLPDPAAVSYQWEATEW
ncbi:hypothetical protein D9601_02440 [Sphingomonas sp. MA1305]|uniref:hypothetical protein n=1 Tax=Sphingomonas sp. MA1305 TaxID=2479204 RepID=UPI0018E04F54|nr:hypothetical protein [Sphingomonas sp. MA1305]MBI0474224.1 hypothetical protein [Sphingomonas sp. MA1305]